MAEGGLDLDVFDGKDDVITHDDGEQETSFIDDEETWEASNETPTWAEDGIPSGISKDQISLPSQKNALVSLWRDQLGASPTGVDLNFVVTKKGDLWLLWGKRWFLLTQKNRPGTFLSASTIRIRYGADVARALGIYEQSRMNREEVAAFRDAGRELEQAAADAGTVEMQDAGQVAANAADALEEALAVANQSTQTDGTPLRELEGLDRALRTTRGEHTRLVANISERRAYITRQEQKLAEVREDTTLSDEERGRQECVIEERIGRARKELNGYVEAAGAQREKLRGQLSRIRDTIWRMLNEDKTLADKIRTLFREQGVTVASILTAIGLAISTLVLALTGGGGGGGGPPPNPLSKGAFREWAKKTLEALKRTLGKLAGIIVASLPGIIGSIVSWVLKSAASVVGWLAENLWAMAIAGAGLLYFIVRDWLEGRKR